MPDRIRAVATIASVAPYPADGLDYLAGMGEENIEEFNAALDESRGAHRVQGAGTGRIFRAVTADEVADIVRRPHRRRRSRLR